MLNFKISVSCSVLQRVAAYSRVLQSLDCDCNTLQYAATRCCSVLQHDMTWSYLCDNVLQCLAACCSVLQRIQDSSCMIFQNTKFIMNNLHISQSSQTKKESGLRFCCSKIERAFRIQAFYSIRFSFKKEKRPAIGETGREDPDVCFYSVGWKNGG